VNEYVVKYLSVSLVLFLCAKAAMLSACLSHRNSVRLSVCHTGGSGGFTDFFHDIGLRKSISFTRRRHRRQRHTRLWPMCIMVPMGQVQVICDFRNYNY